MYLEQLIWAISDFLFFGRDTDVMLLLLHFTFPKVSEVWKISGTAKKQNYVPILKITANVPDEVKNNILSFHALTGCCTTSSLNEYGKILLEKISKIPSKLEEVNRDGELQPVEQLVCNLYGNP